MSVPLGLDSAEMSEPLTLGQATALTGDIRRSVADVEIMVVRAYFGRVWAAMGYKSWDEYIAGEFKSAPLGLPREDRRVQVASLRQQGLSQLAIAAVTGVDQSTISRDVMQMHNQPDRITGADGKNYPATQPDRPTTPPQEVRDTTPVQEESCPCCGQPLPIQEG